MNWFTMVSKLQLNVLHAVLVFVVKVVRSVVCTQLVASWRQENARMLLISLNFFGHERRRHSRSHSLSYSHCFSSSLFISRNLSIVICMPVPVDIVCVRVFIFFLAIRVFLMHSNLRLLLFVDFECDLRDAFTETRCTPRKKPFSLSLSRLICRLTLR